ncbi:DUF1294 domain-containing protein [Alteromonas sediminis]
MKGKLVKWDTEKAFGFIAPNGGGNHIFIHKTAFSNRKRTPQLDDVITFTLSKDKQGRNCAADAMYSGEKIQVKQAKSVSKFSIYLSLLFVSAMTIASILGNVPFKLLYVYVGLSLITFTMYSFDKSKAQRGDWRTPESTLHFLSILGGWPGAAIAQQILRHKSKKKEFRFIFWITVILNVTALAWLLSSHGVHFIEIFR